MLLVMELTGVDGKRMGRVKARRRVRLLIYEGSRGYDHIRLVATYPNLAIFHLSQILYKCSHDRIKTHRTQKANGEEVFYSLFILLYYISICN